MKTALKILVIGTFLIGNINIVLSQSVIKEGAEWSYNLYNFWTSGVGYNKCFISGDTIINQKECLIFRKTVTTCDARPKKDYIYQDGEKIYYYESNLNRFLTLYDFSLEKGDTLTLEYWPGFRISPDSLFYIRVDSTDIFQLDTFRLKRFYVTYDRWDDDMITFSEDYHKGVIIEGIGSLNNFFHFTESGICDGRYNVGLRCFTYPASEPYRFINIPCDSVSNTVQINSDRNIKTYPNPFGENLTISSDFEINAPQIVIYDLNGRELFRKKNDGFQKINEMFELSFLPKALYFLSIFEQKSDGTEQLIFTKKIAGE